MIDLLIERLEKCRLVRPGAYMACCPAHPDKSPSLKITQADDGKILIYCHAGCSADSILAAVSLDWKDLFPDNEPYMRAVHRKPSLPPVDPIQHERTILELARSDIKAGRQLSNEDYSRMKIAIERLKAARL